ncbi:MAG TPA: glutaredoxin-like protein NrdH [Proteus sp.]|uniref:Glutaredoxin-like protein NrdH n=1 Tax=Proteus hauseri ATCC 700826 TaxID=1354271 RepID=A0AAJ3HTQ1_PROHU|nr:glutaredoxin-like protein NrdH [Proteus hauseri]OAT47791.1 glutaredoxin-like protein [Proteus hauseri ATCC 700826]QAV23988.1 glutaredoxin-like protein NrdH [Proteus hauseri]HCH51162.1 glutaredoxin-like protein NrdH [Proteus sp. (in: enterobacteria)]
MSVILYTKPNCVQCSATERALKQKNIPFVSVDLTKDTQALEQIVSMGYRQVPVVVNGEQHWSGFCPDKIRQITL